MDECVAKMVAAKGKDTKARIADAALSLFNSDGENAVTTNHIARAIGISPGNLYYHFANKGEIIAVLFDALDARFRVTLILPIDRELTIDDVLVYSRALADMIYDYRFIFEGIASFVQRSAGFQKQYSMLASDTIAQARAIYSGFVKGGFMVATQQDIEALSDNSWLVLVYWFVHERALIPGRLGRNRAENAVRHLVALFAPMLTPVARTYLNEQMESQEDWDIRLNE
jgi:AcrR family transcriptional regulator